MAGPGVGSVAASDRQLVVLGTASQAPTRSRNHNGYLLLWDDEGLLFDPGEGTQRQMLFAGVTASRITRICITHFHGDHCLGLPGVLNATNMTTASGSPRRRRRRSAGRWCWLMIWTGSRCHPGIPRPLRSWPALANVTSCRSGSIASSGPPRAVRSGLT